MLSNIVKKIRNGILNKTLLEMTGSKENRSLYLTFDDGPTPEVTANLLKVLERYDAKVTFFVIGNKVKKNPDIMRSIIAKGHTVGNHSYNHSNFSKISLNRRFSQIERTNKLINQYTNTPSSLFRVPSGRWTLPILFQVKLLKMRAIHWSVDSLDYDYSDPSVIVKRLLDKPLRPGDILLFHDDSALCVDIMELLLPRLKEKQFDLAAMDY